MSGLTPINWKRFEKFLLFVGCHFEREKGAHKIYWRKDLKRPIVIPRENQLPIFIIRNNLRLLKIDVVEYLKILERI